MFIRMHYDKKLLALNEEMAGGNTDTAVLELSMELIINVILVKKLFKMFLIK